MAGGAGVQHEERDQWGSRVGFLLAAVGSAVGLGNIWRYPYVVYENGGGAFLLPYFLALATAGIPLLVLEYGVGHRSRRSAPFAFAQIRRRWEWLGWFQVAVAFLITTYYMVVIGWVISYVWFSIGTQWGDDPDAFFFGDYLGTSDGFWQVGGLRPAVLVSVALAWLASYLVLRRGVSRGIELAAKVLIPTLVVMILVITVRGLTLPGAAVGLDVLLAPDFGALADPGVWVAAYGQVFFSLSIGFSIMIAYSSYLPRRSDLANSAVIVGLSNAGFEFLAALGVFSVLGFLAASQGVPVTDVVTSGIGLAFVAFPQIINELPGFNSLFGVLFFGALLFAGITSAVSILETGVAALREKFGLSRRAAVNRLCGAAALVSLLFVTRGGVYYLDTVDRFVNNYGIVTAGLLEVVLLAWLVRAVRDYQRHVNEHSYLQVGSWWVAALTVVTPLLLIGVTLANLATELTEPYEGYPLSGLLVFGWGAVGLALAAGVGLQAAPTRPAAPATTPRVPGGAR